MLSRALLFGFLALASCFALPSESSAFGDETSGYLKRTNWAETMVQSRVALPVPNDADLVSFGRWYTTGPIRSSGFEATFFPEEEGGLALDAKQGKYRWRAQDGWPNGPVHALPTKGNTHTTYLMRTINCTKPRQLKAGFGSDDGMVAWLNGRQIVYHPDNRGAAPNSDQVVLDLKPGENTLLIKIYNQGGGHGFYFGTELGQYEPAVRLAEQIERDFPLQAGWLRRDLGDRYVDWFMEGGNLWFEKNMLNRALQRLADNGAAMRLEYETLLDEKVAPHDPRWLDLFERACRFSDLLVQLEAIDVEGVRLAIEDTAARFPDRYSAEPYLARLDRLEQQQAALEAKAIRGTVEDIAPRMAWMHSFLAFQREALLANPLLDFDQILLLRRDFGTQATDVIGKSLGMPTLNSHTHDTINHRGWDNQICVLSDLRGDGDWHTLYTPPGGEILCELDLHFDADRIMFSSIGSHDRWHLFEMNVADSTTKQLTPDDLPDVDFFDSCYLPNGKIATTSTATYQGLPCENGGKPMACIYLLDPETKEMRQITFEQDSDWCPTVLNNGRLLYLRWEYTDIPHYFTRILFHCNPDGTNQTEYYGSNSYFPNAFYFARPIPDHPTKVVGIVGGHHGISRSGQMLILDPALGRHEADGVVQSIGHSGEEVEPIIVDRLYNEIWPHYLHPYPLNDKYFLAAVKPTKDSLWGIYLVDVFNNRTLIAEAPGAALLEPFPLRSTETPPVIPDKIDPNSKEATVYLSNVYYGPGLADVPEGKVKNLRLFAYHYAYNKTGGHASCGIESSWDVKRVLGTVPVDEDGSANFRIPANTPISIQPLDEEGRALQLMRSWMVGMPGEVVSCVGCHEKQNDVVPNRRTYAALRMPSRIEPFYGEARPFSYRCEIQPVLDKYCTGCHNDDATAKTVYGRTIPNFVSSDGQSSYQAIQQFVRRPGPESDYHMFNNMEYHASTSELIQMLEKGHHNVQLDDETWQKLYTWIDLNAPYRGNWEPNEWREQEQISRRLELAGRFAGMMADPEREYRTALASLTRLAPVKPIMPERLPEPDITVPQVPDWPFSADEARQRQGEQAAKRIQLADGISLDMARIPAGRFVMGSAAGSVDELPLTETAIEQPFWMGTGEITNEQFALFDPAHDSRYIDRGGKDHNGRGYPANEPRQPVIRITWHQAVAFCDWLSEKTGKRFTLPTESQWEWACRAGTDTDLWYGSIGDDFAPFANLADQSGAKAKVTPFATIRQVNDGVSFSDMADQFVPNPWGLRNMHGNVAEWTRSAYADGDRRVVRGGSWRDRPHRATSSYRLAYEPYQRVFNVGFRVVCTDK